MTENDALRTYHVRYNNVTYRAVQAAVIADLHGELIASQPLLLDEALATDPANTLMNLVSDTALEFVGHPAMAGRRDRLAAAVLHAGLSAATVRVMALHLANFDRAASADFVSTMLSLLALKAHDLSDLQSQTAALRGEAGVTAYNLVSAAHALLTLTRLTLLNEPSAGYKREKLAAAERSLSYAKAWMKLE